MQQQLRIAASVLAADFSRLGEEVRAIAEAARANNFPDFAAYFDRMLDELFIARMEGNEGIFSRVMTDTEFRSAAHEHLAHEIFRRVRDAHVGE